LQLTQGESGMTIQTTPIRERRSHIWRREANEHYVEPAWCSERLFQEEIFRGPVNDPCCGFGTIPEAAHKAGIGASACDLVDRGYRGGRVEDFFASTWPRDNIVCNPPFNVADRFALHALKLTAGKVAIIFPTARLNAAHWIEGTPLRRVWLMTPRPSMPPGHVITAGQKPGGGKMDFCWLVFERGWEGHAELRRLHRDGSEAP
jgi:hypothetical protein